MRSMRIRTLVGFAFFGLVSAALVAGLIGTARSYAQEGAGQPDAPGQEPTGDAKPADDVPGKLPDLPPPFEESDIVPNGPTPEERAADALAETDGGKGGLVALNPQGTVRIDLKRKLVVVDGKITLREGLLEMFACVKGTKEHESIVAIDSDALSVHAGLLAVGARPGSVVKFDPVYKPAYGDQIEIYVLWKDDAGKPHRVRAQSWILDAKTKKELASEWVFAGSGNWVDPQDGKRYYYGDGGDFICVSNFATATLDLPIQSSESNEALLFEAWTDRIPARGTPVRLVLRVPPNPNFQRELTPPADKAPAEPAPLETPEKDAPATGAPAAGEPGEEPQPEEAAGEKATTDRSSAEPATAEEPSTPK